MQVWPCFTYPISAINEMLNSKVARDIYASMLWSEGPMFKFTSGKHSVLDLLEGKDKIWSTFSQGNKIMA